ncbi:hypothetical protein BGZ63DRAFT_56491 [Mariannaea sp. PMI_226]|nr:hypothetical protein BGZ63DRAFT_56491 [Mariannaea sp. PMI_226]
MSTFEYGMIARPGPFGSVSYGIILDFVHPLSHFLPRPGPGPSLIIKNTGLRRTDKASEIRSAFWLSSPWLPPQSIPSWVPERLITCHMFVLTTYLPTSHIAWPLEALRACTDRGAKKTDHPERPTQRGFELNHFPAHHSFRQASNLVSWSMLVTIIPTCTGCDFTIASGETIERDS